MGPEHRVLIIDDDPAFVKATKVVLESHGYQVDSARDGDEGLAKMEQQKPDLVLLDVIMNWPLEGVHVTREMMRRNELRGIPIIMVTCIVDTQYRELFLQNEYLRIDSGLFKPCSPSTLVTEVKRVLSLYDRHRRMGLR